MNSKAYFYAKVFSPPWDLVWPCARCAMLGLWAGKVVAFLLTHPSAFALRLRMACVVTRQTESRSLSVSKTYWFGVGCWWFYSFFFSPGFGVWLAGYLCGGQEQGKSKSFLEENAGSAHLNWLSCAIQFTSKKDKGVDFYRLKQF